MKKIYIGFMAIAIVGLLISSGCTTPTPKPQQKLCEPSTLEGYKTMCDWTIDGQSNTKCHLQSGIKLEIMWGQGINPVGEGDAIIWTKQDIIGKISQDFKYKTTRVGRKIYSYDAPDGREFRYFCNNNDLCMFYVDTRIENKYFNKFEC